MTITAVILLIFAAITHAGWNFLGKSRHPSVAFLFIANTLGCLCLAPVLFPYWMVLKSFSASVWWWLLLTGLCQAVYYAGLAGAYRTGDLSLAYPLARSAPVIIVTLFNLLAGRGSQLSTQAIIGMFMVAAGGILLPMEHFSDWRIKRYFKLSVLFALMAAFGTAGYSLIDDHVLRFLRGIPDLPAAPVPTLVYAFCEGVSSSLFLGAWVLVRRENRVETAQVIRAHFWQSALAGFGIFLAYTLVLIAMGLVRNVSYVVAFRQSSILLGTLLGLWALREPCWLPKLIGVAIIFCGLVFVGFG